MYEYRRRCALRVFPLPFERNNFFSSPRLIPIYDNPQSYLVEKLPLKSSIFPIINNLFLFPRWIQHRLSSCLRQSKKNTVRVGDNSTRQETRISCIRARRRIAAPLAASPAIFSRQIFGAPSAPPVCQRIRGIFERRVNDESRWHTTRTRARVLH